MCRQQWWYVTQTKKGGTEGSSLPPVCNVVALPAASCLKIHPSGVKLLGSEVQATGMG